MFDSRDPVYKDPVGAVSDRLPVHFKITLPRDLHCSAAKLLVRNDEVGRTQVQNMFWCGMNGDRDEWWECHYAAPEPGLYWYRFSLDTPDGTRFVTRGRGGEGVLEENGNPWQLTIYSHSFQTPDWLAGGVIYQIFPDRFYRSGKKKRNVPPDRRMHADWYESPDWEPDAQGKITNRDYFGADLAGIAEKLPYLQSLGVTCLYLNPIFESHSNHRYNTADYTKVDPLLGTEDDFQSLCSQARKLGIRILLDGVFSHTGSDSVYFNREGRYPEPGAYQSKESPYFPWYRFKSWPDEYDCWWNFVTLPNVDETNQEYNRYINGRDGIIRKWLGEGASGWRLDVADELPDVFLDSLRVSAKAQKPDALILGEVWEDASNKTSYGVRRRYLLGGQLDSVMNYPFRNAVLGFAAGGDPADSMEQILSILENYPPQVLRLLMNPLGTHDTERTLTVLAGEPLKKRDRRWQNETRLTEGQRRLGLRRMRLASLMQYTLPGVPSLYYGDEAGMEGYRDPFNRACYPWGREQAELIQWYRNLGRLRGACSCLKEGIFIPLAASGGVMAYMRSGPDDRLLCAFNSSEKSQSFQLPEEWRSADPLIGPPPDGSGKLRLEGVGCAALRLRYKRP